MSQSSDNPLVSIIIPCFNGEAYLEQTIESCIRQSYQSIEIIIINDGSTDNSLQIAEQWAKKQPNIIALSIQNKGQCFARNQGLEVARGTYIKFLDSDDLLFPFSIEQEIKLITHFNADISVSGEIGFNDSTLEYIQSSFSTMDTDLSKVVHYDSFFALIKTIGFSYNCVLVKKDKVHAVQGFSPSLRAAEESNLNLKLAIKFPTLQVIYNPQKLLLKRLHISSLANRGRADSTPHCLISMYESAKYFLFHYGNNQVLKQYIFDNLYISCVYAFRNSPSNVSLVKEGYSLWKTGKIKKPQLIPFYHDLFHQILGFWMAEIVLNILRNVRYR